MAYMRMPALLKKLILIAVILPALLSLGGCPCGFSCSSDSDRDDTTPASLTLGFSDASLEDLKQVVIEVDSITFRRSGVDDVVVDSFTIDDLGLVDADTFQIDLLEYRGRNQLLVIDDLELDTGTYTSILLTLLEDDLNFSYVEEVDGTLKVINGPAGGLALPGMLLSSGAEGFTVEFGLAQSLQYQDSADTYLLAADGIRVIDTADAASVSGRIDSGLFDLETPCDEKADPESGNRVYLYEGASLGESQLADIYTSGNTNTLPDGTVAPFAVATLVENTLTGSWEYAFGYLPAGDYTLAFTCDAADDDPVDYDAIVIPLPAAQSYQINLSTGERATCDLAEGASCS